MKNKTILALDSGYGIDKEAHFDENGKIVFSKDVSVYAKAPDDAYDMPLFEGNRYYTGDIALMEDSDNIINATDYKSHEFFAPISLWNTMERLRLKPEDISKLIIGLSLEQRKHAKSFVKRLSKFKVNGEIYDFNDKIALVAQALGAKYAIDYFYYDNKRTETFAVFDIGMDSIDTVTSVKGKAREESASGKVGEGVIKIAQKIIEKVGEDYNEIISVKEAQEILSTKKYAPTNDDFSDFIEKISKEYTNFIATIIQQRYRTMFKKYPIIYFVGGGSYFLDKKILMEKTGKTKEQLIFPENAEYYNAIGFLILGKELEKKEKREKKENENTWIIKKIK